MIPVPVIALPISLLVALAMCAGAWFMGDNHGTFVERAAQTQQALANANATIKAKDAEIKSGDKSAEDHDRNNTQVNVDTSAIGRALQNALAKLPPSADPFMPVWWVRNHDRSASRYVGADLYPGKPDDAASDVRMSEAAALLKTDYAICETNRTQLADLIARIKEANAAREKIEPKSLLDRLGL